MKFYVPSAILSSTVIFGKHIVNNNYIQSYNPYECKDIKTKLSRFYFNKNVFDGYVKAVNYGLFWPFYIFKYKFNQTQYVDIAVNKSFDNTYLPKHQKLFYGKHIPLKITDNKTDANYIVTYNPTGAYFCAKYF